MTPRAWAPAALVLSLTGITGCDLPASRPSGGPRIVRITPDLTAGPVDRAQSIRIELDRRVAPGSIPQGVVELTSGDVYVWLDMVIDVVHPALVVTPQDALDPDVDYRLVVHSLRDLDGHASGDSQPIVFHTGTTVMRVVPPLVSYADVAPTLAGCASSGCHAGADAALGLDLSSADALRATALNVQAREVAPSIVGGLGAEVSASLVGMPRIDARNAARSYLLYTMLGDEHIAGAPMPPAGDLATSIELERLQAWIEAGAPGL